MHNYRQLFNNANREQRMISPIAYEKKLYLEFHKWILYPLLFNIFLCDLFLSTESNYFTNYADDITPYVTDNGAEEVVSELKNIAEKLFGLPKL